MKVSQEIKKKIEIHKLKTKLVNLKEIDKEQITKLEKEIEKLKSECKILHEQNIKSWDQKWYLNRKSQIIENSKLDCRDCKKNLSSEEIWQLIRFNGQNEKFPKVQIVCLNCANSYSFHSQSQP